MSQNLDSVVHQILRGATESMPAGRDVAVWPSDQRTQVIDALLPHEMGRRWLRGSLLDELDGDESAELARRLVAFDHDFDPLRRDSTTGRVVAALPIDDLRRSAGFFAGSNAAGPFWERIAGATSTSVVQTALHVLQTGSPIARETTLHILLLDRQSVVRLSGSERIQLLISALSDPEDEVRGMAADALADDSPESLIERGAHLRLDASERARMAAWDAYFAVDFGAARDDAVRMTLDESAPVAPRRTALTALSAILSTMEIAPLLEALVAHPNAVLAEDAVSILWTYHRAPSIASAAASSPHESVRAIAERLLHPETGSPAAGGSRPGSPENDRDIYQEMLRGYEKSGE